VILKRELDKRERLIEARLNALRSEVALIMRGEYRVP
jgi:hypothetical protein